VPLVSSQRSRSAAISTIPLRGPVALQGLPVERPSFPRFGKLKLGASVPAPQCTKIVLNKASIGCAAFKATIKSRRLVTDEIVIQRRTPRRPEARS
jgi:hypothetical protein